MTGASLLLHMRESVKEQIKEVSEAEVKQAEHQLNYFYGDTNKGLKKGLIDEQRKKIIEDDGILKIIEDQGKSLANLHVDYSNLNAIRVQTAEEPNVQKLKNIGEKSYTSLKAIMRRIEELRMRRNIINDGDKDLLKKIDDFLNSDNLKNVEKELKKIEEEARKRRGSDAVKDVHLDDEWLKQHKSTFIDVLNDLISRTSIASDREMLGLVSEYLVSVLPYMYQNNLQEATSKLLGSLIDENWVGSQRTAKILNEDLVFGVKHGERNSKNGVVKWEQLGINNSEVDFTYTQNKVDALIKLSSSKKLNASVKNYNVQAEAIHILKGSSILKYLQLYPELGTHYLNITAHANQREKAPAIDIKQAHTAMLVALGTHALAGGLYGADKEGMIKKLNAADVLVVNWRNGKNGHFRVYPIYKMLDKIEDSLIFNAEGRDLSQPVEWNNPFVFLTGHENRGRALHGQYKAGYVRCIKILQQLHNTQLSASIDVKNLDKSKNF